MSNRQTLFRSDNNKVRLAVALKSLHPAYRARDEEIEVEVKLVKNETTKELNFEYKGGQGLFDFFDAYVSNRQEPNNYMRLFDFPYALRITQGLLDGFNQLDLERNERKVVFDSDKKNLFVMINCNTQSQSSITSRAIGADEFELSGMQNIFEVLLPHGINIQLGNETYMDEMVHWMANKETV